jgi:glutaredoxin-like protein NrdH
MDLYMNVFIKNIFSVFLGLVIGYFSVITYQWLNKPNFVEQGDFKLYVQGSNFDKVLYTTSWCSNCKQAKLFLTQNNILFEEKDIESNIQWKDELAELESDSVPLLVMKDRKITGFYRPAYIKLAKIEQ